MTQNKDAIEAVTQGVLTNERLERLANAVASSEERQITLLERTVRLETIIELASQYTHAKGGTQDRARPGGE